MHHKQPVRRILRCGIYHESNIFFFVILIFSNQVSALGITSRHSVNYETGLDQDFQICIKNSENYAFPVDVYAEGGFSEYVTIQETEFTLAPNAVKCIIYNLNMPGEIDVFGGHTTRIWARQLAPVEGGSFNVLSNIHHKLNVFVPYPEKYVQLAARANDVNENQPVQIVISAWNRGSIDIEAGNAELDIFGADDYTNFLTTLYTLTKPIPSLEKVEYFATFDTFGLKPGYYKLNVDFFFDDLVESTEAFFKIGTLFVRINNHSVQGTAGTINPFFVEAESRWNNNIGAFHSEFIIEELSLTVKSPTSDLESWEETRIDNFIDLRSVPPGLYQGKLILHYDGEVTEKIFDYTVVGDKVVAQDEPAIVDAKASTSIITLSNILLVLILLLVIIDLAYLYFRRK